MMPSSAGGKIPGPRGEFPARVLIVDDEPLVRWSLSAGLCLAGFDAVTASNSEEALTFACQRPQPDIILIDLDLFNTDPAALLEGLRRAAPQCRFLLMATAEPDALMALPDGVLVIRKPFDLPEVVRLVATAGEAARRW